MKKSDKNLDKFYSKTAFYLGLGFWVPLFNIAICITGLVFSILAIKKIYKEPKVYGGMKFAIAGMILSLSGIVLTIIGLVIYLNSEDICGSAICQDLQAQ